MQGFQECFHHVVPIRHGCLNESSPYYGLMGTSENCVLLCHACHHAHGHGGDYRNGKLALPEDFKYSHGDDFQAHKKWAIWLKEEKSKGLCLFWTQPR
jgi:hypothetical protein